MKSRVDRKPVQAALSAWYVRNHRDLPWRGTDDPYRIWLSEVMLQQTQVAAVIPYYHRWLARLPAIFDLAAAPLSVVLRLWEGLGYYARARNFHAAAGRVVVVHGGRVPDSPEQFRALPGVGPYICAAVMSIAFGRPMAVVDGNVKRVLARLNTLDPPVNHPAAKRVFQAAADRLLVQADPATHNQAMMELGALICTPRAPACADCPLRGWCRAWECGKVEAYPRRVARKKVPTVRSSCVIIRQGDAVLLVRRPESGLLGGMWEFPNREIGKVETAEGVAGDLVRQVPAAVSDGLRPLGVVHHAYTHFKLSLTLFACTVIGNAGRPPGGAWVPWDGLDGYALHKAARKCEALVRSG